PWSGGQDARGPYLEIRTEASRRHPEGKRSPAPWLPLAGDGEALLSTSGCPDRVEWKRSGQSAGRAWPSESADPRSHWRTSGVPAALRAEPHQRASARSRGRYRLESPRFGEPEFG